MKLSIQLTKKHVFLISLLAILIGIGIVYAYGTTNPPVMGHTLGELDASGCNNGQILEKVNDAWACGSKGTITETDPQVGSVTSGKWCVGDDNAVQCTENAPSGSSQWTTESDGDIYYSGGNVGIGKSVGSAVELDVERANTNGWTAYFRNTGTSTSSHGIGIQTLADNSDIYSLKVSGSDATEPYLAIMGDGKVGIGTSSPQATVDVIGDVRIYSATVDIASSCTEASWGIIKRCQVPGGNSGKSLCTCARQGTGSWTWKFIHYPS